MAMLYAAARVARNSVSVVATFDHGTGAAASRAASLVVREAAALGFPVVLGHATHRASTEAAWRAMRLEFLNDVARRLGAVVATAHTRDDQVETVLMRVLRDSGARGLAGLYAGGDFVRPLLDVSRDAVANYAEAVGATWVDDPTNTSAKHLRNRVRRDLLPALSRVRPGFEREVLEIARHAADWREVLEDVVSASIRVERRADGVSVPANALTGLTANELAVLWPAIAARAGARTDWRGTERVVEFTKAGRVGARIPLTGGWEVARARDAFELRRAREAPAGAEPLRNGLAFDCWTFSSLTSAPRAADAWTARLPSGALAVRTWRAGDRMRTGDGGTRRVKRYLTDAKVSGSLRARWPVVVSGSEVVWIPGVRHGHVAVERPGRPGVLFRCELNDR